jgi:VWFA-related protein
MIRSLCALLLFLSTLGASAQVELSATNQDQDKVFRVSVDLVQVDAVVTDKKGRPVDDLTVDDFIVLQDGKPQKITSFSMIRMEDSSPRPRAVPRTSVSKEKGSVSPPPPPVSIKRDQVRRTIAIVVDDLGLSAPSTVYVRESIHKWIDTEMRPGDLVAIILTGSGMGSLQQFTADKRMLHAAADRILYNLSGRIGVSSFAAISTTTPVMSAEATEERNMALTLGTIGSIHYALAGLKDVPGRKSLIFFSEDMGMTSESSEMVRTGALSGDRAPFVRQYLQRLIDEANRAAVVIHAIDPRGVVYTGPTAEDSMNGLDAEGISNVFAQRSTQLESSRDGMWQMTKLTGGLFEYNRNDIDGALNEVAEDGKVYYLLGYEPDEKTASRMREGKRHFYSIDVRVKRPGLTVRSRDGFFATSEEKTEPLTRRERMQEALYSPFSSGTLPVRLTTLFAETKNKKFCINALLHFFTDQLTFTEEDGWQKAVVDVAVTTFDVNGEQIDLMDRRWTIMAKGGTFEEMQKCGIVYMMRIPVKKAGAYQMRAVVSDTRSAELGSASQFVEVPDLGKGKLALSGIALAADERAIGGIEDQREGMVADKEVNRTVAVRGFLPGDTLRWAYQVLNAKTGKDNKSQLKTYVRLFHEGEEVYAANPADITRERDKDSDRLIGTGSMQLNKAVPGDYALQVVVLDMLANEKNRVAVQSINFEVRGQKLRPMNTEIRTQ